MELHEFLQQNNLNETPIFDGEIHRFNTGESSSDSGWYVGFIDQSMTCLIVGDWANGASFNKWTSKKRMSDLEKIKFQTKINEMRQKQKEAREKQYEEKSAHVSARLESAANADQNHPYLVRKKIKAGSVKTIDGNLAISLQDITGKIWSLQTIDANGSKKFETGARVRGCFHLIGGENVTDTILICEGFATGQTLFEATGFSVFCAMNVGNIEEVYLAIKEKYPNSRIINCADNDRHKDRNAGLEMAKALRSKHDLEYITPNFENLRSGTDFNDLYLEINIDAVKKSFDDFLSSDFDINDFIKNCGGFYRETIDRKTNEMKYIPDFMSFGSAIAKSGSYKSTVFGDFIYQNGFWKRILDKDKDNLVLRINQMISVPTQYRSFQTEMDAHCRSEKIGKDTAGFINLNNGIINVKTGELLNHSKEFGFTTKAAVDFDKDAKCEKWIEFLNVALEGDFERIACIQQMIGYILLGGKPFLQKAFILFGDGRNGKSVFMYVLRELLGHDLVSSVSLKAFSEKFETVMLDGKLANISGDEGDDFRVSTGAFKLAVSGESLLVQQKGLPAYNIDVNARFIFSCNKFPYFGERSHALLDRLIVIPFDRTILEEDKDPHLDVKLTSELSGILNWAIDGAKQVLATKSIIHARQSILAKAEMTEDVDPFANWVEENLAFSGLDTSESTEELFSHFKRCMAEDGLTKTKFGKIGFARELKRHVRKFYSEKNRGIIPPELQRRSENKDKKRTIIGVSFSKNKRVVRSFLEILKELLGNLDDVPF